MSISFFLLVISIVLISCSTHIDSSTTQSSTTPELIQQSSSIIPSNSEQKALPTAEALTISAKSIGMAELGMTFGQLKRVLGTDVEFKVVSPFMVDLDAIAVSKSGKTQYYILYPAETTFADTSIAELLLTENPNFKTVEGVGTGMSLEQAEVVYGEATLSHNTQNESREQVKFARQPIQNIIFRPTAPDGDFAGIYPSLTGEYNETKKFRESAFIRSVLVQ